MSEPEQTELLLHDKGERVVSPLLGFAAMLVVNAAYLAYKGVFIAPDSSFYMKGAEGLIATGFDFQQFLQDSPRFGQYIGFVTWCAILKSLFGDNWPVGVVAANAIANALTVATMIYHLKRVGIRWQSRLYVIIWSMVAFDMLVWSKGLLSDPTFLVLATAAVTLSASCVRPAKVGTGPNIALIGITVLLSVAAICWRPTGIALIIPLCVCTMLRFLPQNIQINRFITLLVIGIFVEAGFLAFAWFMQQPEEWPFPVGGGNISYTAYYYDQGQVVWKRYATYHAEPETLLDYHLITLDRLRYWFACFESEFCFAHKLYNCVFYIPLFAGSFVALVLWARRTFHNNTSLDRLTSVLLSMVLAFSAMHAMLQVDYGWRYRVPIIPCLMMLTAVAINSVIRSRRNNASTQTKN